MDADEDSALYLGVAPYMSPYEGVYVSLEVMLDRLCTLALVAAL